MKTVKTAIETREISSAINKEGKTLALVPTMGYFHKGHTSLMKKARELADYTVVSLYVNPTQFAPNEDFAKYPRDFDRDFKIAEDIGVDYLFNPSDREMYPEGYNTFIKMGGITEKLEGEKRPTHFNGVATIVAKLFNCTNPDFAVFGQKDYQQSLVIKKLIADLNFGVKIALAPIVREQDGLALSSRNIYLTPKQRRKALYLYKALESGEKAIDDGERERKKINAHLIKTLREPGGIQIDYARAVDADTLEEPEIFKSGDRVVFLLACYVGTTRLIDNALITIP